MALWTSYLANKFAVSSDLGANENLFPVPPSLPPSLQGPLPSALPLRDCRAYFREFQLFRARLPFTLKGLPYMTSTNFLDFWTPFTPFVHKIYTDRPQIWGFYCWDVIYESPLNLLTSFLTQCNSFQGRRIPRATAAWRIKRRTASRSTACRALAPDCAKSSTWR